MIVYLCYFVLPFRHINYTVTIRLSGTRGCKDILELCYVFSFSFFSFFICIVCQQ